MPNPPTAYLFCPAYPLRDAPHLAQTQHAAAELAAAIGHTLVESPLLPHTDASRHWLPLAERLADLERGCAHGVLLAARGGYGCVQLLTATNRLIMPPIIGFSDLTALHALQLRRGGPEGYYGAMPGVAHGARARNSLATLIRGNALTIEPKAFLDVTVLRAGTAHGRLIPACLRVLTGLVGTPAMPDLSGSILAIEDIDERAYQVDRDLHQLHATGALDNVAGLIAGLFPVSASPSPDGPSTAAIIRAWAERLRIPALFGLPFGHHADPLTLPVGRPASLTVASDADHAPDWHLAIQARA